MLRLIGLFYLPDLSFLTIEQECILFPSVYPVSVTLYHHHYTVSQNVLHVSDSGEGTRLRLSG